MGKTNGLIAEEYMRADGGMGYRAGFIVQVKGRDQGATQKHQLGYIKIYIHYPQVEETASAVIFCSFDSKLEIVRGSFKTCAGQIHGLDRIFALIQQQPGESVLSSDARLSVLVYESSAEFLELGWGIKSTCTS